MVRQSTDYANAKIDDYLNILEKNIKAKPETIREYRRLLRHAVKALLAAEMNATPSRIGEDEMILLQDEVYAHLDPVTNRRQIGIFGTYLKHYDNNVLEKMHLAWPQGRRLSVKWLPPEQCVKLLDAAEGMERMIVHFELLLLMRRCEVKRLTVKTVKWNVVDVQGKGRCEGKWRTVPWSRETLGEIQYYQKLREDMIEKALERDQNAVIPGQFMLYCQYGWKLGAYQDTALDNLIKSAARRAGIDETLVSNHVLRRSGARMMIYSGSSITEVSSMLGHADTATTMIYLGLTVDDLARVQEKRDDYLESIRMKVKANPEAYRESVRPTLFAR
jgi:site-specific recombinase XerD